MADKPDEEISEIALAIEQRERKLFPFDVRGFFGLGDREIPRLGIRVLMQNEQNLAITAAHNVAKSYAREDDDIRRDPELLDDLKLAEAMHRACFVADKKTKHGHPIQAFPSGRWMEKHFSTEQLAVLHNLQLEVRKAESPMLWDINMQDIMALAEGCAKTRDGDMPEALLAPCSREYMTSAFVLLAGEWWQMKQKQDMIDQALEETADGVHSESDEPAGGVLSSDRDEAEERSLDDDGRGEGSSS
jgi:hypothetical protein